MAEKYTLNWHTFSEQNEDVRSEGQLQVMSQEETQNYPLSCPALCDCTLGININIDLIERKL